jgi:kumamolisin
MFFKFKLNLSTGTALAIMAAAVISTPALAGPNATSGLIPQVHPAPGPMKGVAVSDLGLSVASKVINTTIVLKLSDEKKAELKNFVKATVTPGDPQYHKFLTVAQFRERFAPSSQSIQEFMAYLQSHGIRVSGVDPDGLGFNASGTIAQFDGAFSTQIHDFLRNGQRFHSPASNPVVPAQFDGLFLGAIGLNNESGLYRPMLVHSIGKAGSSNKLPMPQWHTIHHGGTATGEPGFYTVGDVANFYQVNPLYQAKIKGQGRTIGIMTFANFSITDVNTYWQQIGLNVSPSRTITRVKLNCTAGVSCLYESGVGVDETSLDVEQSGGLAPGANIIVYVQGLNNNQGLVGLFRQAANDNIADTVSISWGLPEAFYFAAFNGGVDLTGSMQAVDNYLLQGAAQGQSFFAATGDSGAYDTARGYYLGGYGYDPLSVDFPSSDPNITAAGGTTIGNVDIPGFQGPNGYCNDIYTDDEGVWGWDYIYYDWGSCLGLSYSDLEFVGGGGGVSSYWGLPYYQAFLQGTTQTVPGQTFNGYGVDYTFPADFNGRNTPDISLNADPEIGYLVYDTADFGGFADGYGGTSFVAPQLNGMTALVDQAVGTRVGFLNPAIYLMQQLYGSGPPSPFNYVYDGDNWYYCGAYCFNDAAYGNGAGIGSLNLGDLALAFGWKPPYVVQSQLQQH